MQFETTKRILTNFSRQLRVLAVIEKVGEPVMLQVRTERKGNTAIVHCAGRLLLGQEVSKVRDAVLCAIDKETIVLDLAEVERIDASGLGLLVFLHTCTHGLGNDLMIAPSSQVEEILELTGLDQVFTICPARDVSRYLELKSGDNALEACA